MTTQGKWAAAWLLSAAAALTAVFTGGCGDEEGSAGGPSTSQPKSFSLSDLFGGNDDELAGEYTIHLHRYEGQDRIKRAEIGKYACEERAKWKDVFIVTEQEASTLYWGRFNKPEDAYSRLQAARQLRTPKGFPFQGAYIAPMPGGPVGKPEYDLQNAPGMYTIVVECYCDNPDYGKPGTADNKGPTIVGRRAIAAKRVEELRQSGEEAYYYHGPVNSIVTIGAFPESSVVYSKDGAALQPQVADLRIQRVLSRHPLLFTNGNETSIAVPDMNTGKARWVDRPSYIARIPGREPTETDRRLSEVGQPSQARQPARTTPAMPVSNPLGGVGR